MERQEIERLAGRLVELAAARGATAVEATVRSGDEFEAQVRRGEIETIKQAGSRAAGVRVLFGQRVGSAYTSDLTDAGLLAMVESAAGLARISTEDPSAGLPDSAELGALASDLDLYSDRVDALPPDERIALSRVAEKAAFDFDPRIETSEGASYGSQTGWRAFANSDGFVGSERGSACSLSVIPVAAADGRRERDYWYSAARSPELLESPEVVGKTAARRALRRLGARKAPTQTVPVVFEPRVACSIVGHLFEAVAGDSIYQQASFLAGRLGERIASSAVTLIDDPTLAGRLGSSAFDDEGVRSRRKVVIEGGVLSTYLLNTYAARKLGMKTTGNASRGLTGNASIGHGNLYLQAGDSTPEQIISGIKNGLYVTELLGSGVNIVNGDYSRGAVGVWIEGGELTWPVHEITIAGNLRQMLERIEAVASDLDFRGSIASPTLLIGEMTVSGH
jgi:PmbA protein